jgi:hypothetical protein
MSHQPSPIASSGDTFKEWDGRWKGKRRFPFQHRRRPGFSEAASSKEGETSELIGLRVASAKRGNLRFPLLGSEP